MHDSMQDICSTFFRWGSDMEVTMPACSKKKPLIDYLYRKSLYEILLFIMNYLIIKNL